MAVGHCRSATWPAWPISASAAAIGIYPVGVLSDESTGPKEAAMDHKRPPGGDRPLEQARDHRHATASSGGELWRTAVSATLHCLTGCEPPWVAWRLLTLETRMEPCRKMCRR